MERNYIRKTMKTLVDPKNHESLLAQWGGAEAKIWMFHVTHNRMALTLYRKDQSEAVYIVGVACKHISGPFSWNQANVSIVTETPNQWGEVHRRIIDKKAGFELLCSDVVIVLGVPSVPGDLFDNFLGDAK